MGTNSKRRLNEGLDWLVKRGMARYYEMGYLEMQLDLHYLVTAIDDVLENYRPYFLGKDDITRIKRRMRDISDEK